jgi:hypothetical protein
MARLPRDVVDSINAQLPKEIGKRVEAIVVKGFNKIKADMLREFETHPITVELEGGPGAANSSGTLGGYGNLFTFIGFPENHDPISPVRERLKAVVIRRTGYSRGVFNFITNEPTRDELFSMTKISSFRGDFEGGRSWLDGIETGLSGLGYYLYSKDKDLKGSRSGPAIQLGGGKRAESAKGSGSTGGAVSNQRSRYERVSYVSGILKRFNKSINRLRSSTLR